MSSEWSDVQSQDSAHDEFTEKLLTVEYEPAVDGGERAILYPPDVSSEDLATNWLAVSANFIISLEDVQ